MLSCSWAFPQVWPKGTRTGLMIETLQVPGLRPEGAELFPFPTSVTSEVLAFLRGSGLSGTHSQALHKKLGLCVRHTFYPGLQAWHIVSGQ
jgi:hypothetical protein